MDKKNIMRIMTIVLIAFIILLQVGRIYATPADAILGNNDELSQITGENGEGSSLTVEENETFDLNDLPTNSPTDNKVANNVNNNKVNNNTANKNNTTLPQTGTNENIIISLILVFVAVGAYTFKKVRDYNI